MSSDPSSRGQLRANQWTKVYWAWGVFVATYVLYTNAPQVYVRFYGTITAGIPIPRGPFVNNEEFSVPVIGYSDLWFQSSIDANYQIRPVRYRHVREFEF
jgi:hypothetical protein